MASLIRQQDLFFDACAEAETNAALAAGLNSRAVGIDINHVHIVTGGAGSIASPAVRALQRAGFSLVLVDKFV